MLGVYQNKRSKFKKLLKQAPGPGGTALTPQPGNTALSNLSPSNPSDDEQDASVGHGSTPGPQGHPGSTGQGHSNNRLTNGQGEGVSFDSPSPQQSGHLMSPPPVSATPMLPPSSALGPSMANPLSSAHNVMSPLAPPMSHLPGMPPGLHRWTDSNGDHAHGSPVTSHMQNMYSGQYLPPTLPQYHGGWSYGAPQNSMIT